VTVAPCRDTEYAKRDGKVAKHGWEGEREQSIKFYSMPCICIAEHFSPAECLGRHAFMLGRRVNVFPARPGLALTHSGCYTTSPCRLNLILFFVASLIPILPHQLKFRSMNDGLGPNSNRPLLHLDLGGTLCIWDGAIVGVLPCVIKPDFSYRVWLLLASFHPA
jgi:hypothetical protein